MRPNKRENWKEAEDGKEIVRKRRRRGGEHYSRF